MEPLSQEQIEQQRGAEWRYSESALVRELKLSDFAAAVGFVNAVAALAQAADHHPDILLHGYNKVLLTLSTHSAGGVTERDIALAAAIDKLA